MARRAAAALLRPAAAAALVRPAAPLLRPAAARYYSTSDYGAFVGGLREISKAAQADENYFTGGARDKADSISAGSLRDKADSIRAATHDGEVLRVIDDALRAQHRGLIEEISNNFPFEIRKKEGTTDITLTRSLKGEKIEVLFSMPKLDPEEEGDKDRSNSLSSSSENQEEEGKTPQEEYSLPIRVTVSKAYGSGLKFNCTAHPDKIVIESMSMMRKPPGVEEDDAGTFDEGPDFRELDKNLQETFHTYLEVRGITPTTTKVLHQYMISKDGHDLPKGASMEKRKNLAFLMKLCNFIKKD
ncbi:unnamed protein product [Alopecurus aequalis]